MAGVGSIWDKPGGSFGISLDSFGICLDRLGVRLNGLAISRSIFGTFKRRDKNRTRTG